MFDWLHASRHASTVVSASWLAQPPASCCQCCTPSVDVTPPPDSTASEKNTPGRCTAGAGRSLRQPRRTHPARACTCRSARQPSPENGVQQKPLKQQRLSRRTPSRLLNDRPACLAPAAPAVVVHPPPHGPHGPHGTATRCRLLHPRLKCLKPLKHQLRRHHQRLCLQPPRPSPCTWSRSSAL